MDTEWNIDLLRKWLLRVSFFGTPSLCLEDPKRSKNDLAVNYCRVAAVEDEPRREISRRGRYGRMVSVVGTQCADLSPVDPWYLQFRNTNQRVPSGGPGSRREAIKKYLGDQTFQG